MIIVAQMFGAIVGSIVLITNSRPEELVNPGFALATSAGLGAVIFGQIYLGLK